MTTRRTKSPAADLKAFKASLDEMVKFAQGKKAKVKVETLVVKTKGHDVNPFLAPDPGASSPVQR